MENHKMAPVFMSLLTVFALVGRGVTEKPLEAGALEAPFQAELLAGYGPSRPSSSGHARVPRGREYAIRIPPLVVEVALGGDPAAAQDIHGASIFDERLCWAPEDAQGVETGDALVCIGDEGAPPRAGREPAQDVG